MLQILRCAKPDIIPSICDMLNQVTLACDLCLQLHSPPFRFRASLPPVSIKFNHEAPIDLMWLDGNPVLNVVDVNTGIKNVVFDENKTSEKLWENFVLCWDSAYKGSPNRIRLEK